VRNRDVVSFANGERCSHTGVTNSDFSGSESTVAGSVVQRQHLEGGILDLLGVAMLMVRHAENDVGELDACGLDRQRVVTEVGCNARPRLIE
jgi:hypothetical protein